MRIKWDVAATPHVGWEAKGAKEGIIIRRILKFNQYKYCYLIKNQYCSKDIKEKHILYLPKKLIKFHGVVMIIKEDKHFIILHHIHMHKC